MDEAETNMDEAERDMDEAERDMDDDFFRILATSISSPIAAHLCKAHRSRFDLASYFDMVSFRRKGKQKAERVDLGKGESSKNVSSYLVAGFRANDLIAGRA